MLDGERGERRGAGEQAGALIRYRKGARRRNRRNGGEPNYGN